jgi:Elongation factor G C-terminus
LAFRNATTQAFKKAFVKAGGTILGPVMKVELTIPSEYQAHVIGGLNRRKGIVLETENKQDFLTVHAEVSLMWLHVCNIRVRGQRPSVCVRRSVYMCVRRSMCVYVGSVYVREREREYVRGCVYIRTWESLCAYVHVWDTRVCVYDTPACESMNV